MILVSGRFNGFLGEFSEVTRSFKGISDYFQRRFCGYHVVLVAFHGSLNMFQSPQEFHRIERAFQGVSEVFRDS